MMAFLISSDCIYELMNINEYNITIYITYIHTPHDKRNTTGNAALGTKRKEEPSLPALACSINAVHGIVDTKKLGLSSHWFPTSHWFVNTWNPQKNKSAKEYKLYYYIGYLKLAFLYLLIYSELTVPV
jgi:hypothetical protein